MVNMEFGKNIEKLIQFSGQKNYSLAKELGYEYIFDVFFNRAYQLGAVGKQQYREYQLSKLGV